MSAPELIQGRRYHVTAKRSGTAFRPTYTGRYLGEAPSPVGNEWAKVFGPVEECGAMAVYISSEIENAEEL